MTLDAEDRINLTYMRYKMDAPKVADLIVDMDKQYGELPAMKQVNATFSSLAKANPDQLKKLNAVLDSNPGLAEKIKANLGRDPQAFSTQFLPAVFKDPGTAVTLVDQPAAKVAAAPASAPAKQPMIQKSYDYPEPGPVRAAVAGLAGDHAPEAKRASAPAQAANAPAAGTETTDQRISKKMAELGRVDGFNDLMDRVDKDPNLGAAMAAVMSSEGTAQDREHSIDTLLNETKKNPKFFRNIVKQIDDNPGAVSTIAGQIAGDPKNALSKLTELGDDNAMGGMGGLGMFAKMFAGGGGIGSFLSGGGLMKMITMLITAVSTMFGGSGNHLVIGNNNLLEQYGETVKATNAKPNQVAVIDASGTVTSGAQAQVATTATDQTRAAPNTLPQNRNG